VTEVPSRATACVAVAYSGGRDSTALLHATAVAAQGQGIEVLALHVHHGLSPHADDWLAHGEQQVRAWAARGLPVSFHATRLHTRPERGQSIEAWAREARYAALREVALAHGADTVLLAHHQRDQAETFVLQALRGAGLAGLSAMPVAIDRDGMHWLRPWLHQSGAAVAAYVQAHALTHIEDDSNLDPKFDRNRLRHAVWPALVDAFAQAEPSLARASAWAQEAAQALAELAQLDLAACTSRGGAVLHVPAWARLSAVRRSNALRAWLLAQTSQPAAASLCERLMVELRAAGAATWPCHGGVLRLYRGRLSWAQAVGAAIGMPNASKASTLSIRRAGRYRLAGWGGLLLAERVAEGGVSLAWLGHLSVHERAGGEQFQAGFGRPPRSLKKQFQAAALPEWVRQGPLLSSGGQLIFVPGLGIDARAVAWPGQPQMALKWLPDGGGVTTPGEQG
jgi:tRNA(Ile)-lysidine synthase